jgi:hypothetical protein
MTGEVIFNVKDYGNSIQNTLDLISSDQSFLKRGGTVYIPRGQYVENLVVRGGRITLRGENLDTTIHPLDPTKPAITLVATGEYKVHDLVMENFQVIAREKGEYGENLGVGIQCIGTPDTRPGGLNFRRVFVNEFATGSHFDNCDFPHFDGCGAWGNDIGVFLKDVSQVYFEHCFIQHSHADGIYGENLLGFYFQGPGVQANIGAQIFLKNCSSVLIERSDIEEFKDGIILKGCRGVGINNNVFLPESYIDGETVRGVILQPSELHKNSGVQIIGNVFFGSNSHNNNYARTIGVTIEDNSCTDIFLANNCPGSATPARLTMYDYPRNTTSMKVTELDTTTGDGFEADKTLRGFKPSNISVEELRIVNPKNDGFIAWDSKNHRLMVNINGVWKRAFTL